MRFLLSLSGKIILLNSLVVLLTTATLLFFAQQRLGERVQEDFSAKAEMMTEFLSRLIAPGARLKRESMLAEALDLVFGNEQLALAATRIIHVDGTLVSERYSEALGAGAEAQFTEADFETARSATLQGEWLYVREPIYLGQGSEAVLVGEIATVWSLGPSNAVRSEVFTQLRLLAGGLGLVVIVITLGALFLLIGRPLSQAVAALRAVGAEETDITLPKSQSQEIIEINRAVEGLQKVSQERTEFLGSLTGVLESAKEGDYTARIGGDTKMAQMVDDLLQSVADGLEETQKVLSQLADGRLSARMSGDFKGAFAELQNSANAMAASLGATISSVSGSAMTISDETASLNSSVEDLALRTQRSAAMLQETAQSVGSISESLKHTAQVTADAEAQTGIAIEQANNGEAIVARAVAGMNNIQQHAMEIGNITSLIDDVAFQTSLLALNAGVEAARAGEEGRGFAVVASEVRALAQRAAEAASQIKGLIEDSTTEVQRGVESVAEAGEAIKGIVGAIDQVSSRVEEIAASSAEQSTSVDEINTAVRELDNVSQENAAMVEETSAMAGTMKKTAESMIAQVQVFDLGGIEEPEPSELRLSA